VIIAKNISKKFGTINVINNFSMKTETGEFIAITGDSGKGKTTLLNILGLLEKPSNGSITFLNKENPSKKETMLLQRHKIGYLFQNYALIENESVKNNLNLALKYRKDINKNEEIKKSLSYVNLDNFENKKIYELSGGEQQRVALARILVKDCSYIFADEPTGNLDRRNRDIVFDILKDLNSMGKTILYVTHDEELANQANSRILL